MGTEVEHTGKWCVIMSATYIIGSGFDLLVEFVLVLIPERRVAHEQNIQNYTCVDILQQKKIIYRVK